MAFADEILKMSIEEKLEAMELLWASISENPSEYQSPEWHFDILKERERKLASGESRMLSWDEVQRSIEEKCR